MLKNLRKRFSGNPITRRKAWSKYYERKLARRGLHSYKGHLNWTLSSEFHAVLEAWGTDPGIPDDRLYLLWELGRMLHRDGVGGATMECGTRFGKSSFVFLHGFGRPERAHYVFDSFEGLGVPSEEDRENEHVRAWEPGEMSADESHARRNLAEFPNVSLHKGWIPDRFPDASDEAFCFVHLDVDLFQPTMDTLNFAWERLVDGGVVVCDDYGLATCPGAKRAFDEFFADGRASLLPVPSGQVLVWKR